MGKVIKSCETCRYRQMSVIPLPDVCMHPNNGRVDRQAGQVYHRINGTVLDRCEAGGWFQPTFKERIDALFRRR